MAVISACDATTDWTAQLSIAIGQIGEIMVNSIKVGGA